MTTLDTLVRQTLTVENVPWGGIKKMLFIQQEGTLKRHIIGSGLSDFALKDRIQTICETLMVLGYSVQVIRNDFYVKEDTADEHEG